MVGKINNNKERENISLHYLYYRLKHQSTLDLFEAGAMTARYVPTIPTSFCCNIKAHNGSSIFCLFATSDYIENNNAYVSTIWG